MKKTILKIISSIIVFVGTLFLSSFLLNRGNVNTTKSMEKATLPIVIMNIGGMEVNELYGHTEDCDLALLRESITPLDDQRGVSFRIEKHGCTIKGITAKVRTVDGSRLIEATDIKDYSEDDFNITAGIKFKNLMEEYTEYSLQIYLTFQDGSEAFYHTRIVEGESYCIKEKLSFVNEFVSKEMSLDTNEELKPYMECNSLGDNTTLANVNIHSSMAQVAFGDLNAERITEPVITVKEICSETGCFLVNYLVKVTDHNEETRYFVEEFFRTRYAGENSYLLDFDRTMRRIINIDTPIVRTEDIFLGITDSDLGLIESEDGNVIAFVNENVLFSFNANGNKLARIFSFYDEDNFDKRTYHNEHKVKALNVDEAGNVWFAVFGYMNRGTYEGKVGVTLYYFNGVTSEVEEKFFIPSDKSPEILMRDLSEVCFYSREGIFYFMMDKSIYAVNVENKTVETLVSNLEENKYSASDNASMMVWQQESDVNASKTLMLMNLNTKQITEIDAPIGQCIKPLVFMGEDFVYGLANIEDVVTDTTGRTTFPMHTVKIQSKFGEVLKQYQNEGTYVTQGTVKDSMLTLSRVKKAEGDVLSYVSIDSEFINNNQEKEELQNIIDVNSFGNYQKVVKIILKSDVNGKVVKIEPKEVIYEGSKELSFERAESTHEYFYVYYKGKLQKIYTNPSNAVTEADENRGTVLNDKGYYAWYRANRYLRNQIMDLSPDSVSCEEGEELPFCLDKMMEYEGVVRNSQFLLSKGETVLSILKDALEGKEVLDLTGCSLDTILYYVNRDIPVLALTHTNETYLVIGFNQLAVVVLDPQKGWYKLGLNEAEKLFLNNGNQFITYVPNEE